MIVDPEKPKFAASMLQALKELKALRAKLYQEGARAFETLIGTFSVAEIGAGQRQCSLQANTGETIAWVTPDERSAYLSVRSLYLSIVRYEGSAFEDGIVEIQDRQGSDILAFRFQVVRMLMVHSLAERIAAIERREEEPEIIKCMSMTCAELGECWKEHGQAVWHNADHSAYSKSFVEPIVLTRTPAPSPAP